MDSSSTPSNKMFPSALSAALEILATNQFSEDDLPRKISSPIWARIEKDFSLTLGQLSALQNLVESKNVASPVSDNTLPKEIVKARASIKRKIAVTNGEGLVSLTEPAEKSEQLQQDRSKYHFGTICIDKQLYRCFFL